MRSVLLALAVAIAMQTPVMKPACAADPEPAPAVTPAVTPSGVTEPKAQEDKKADGGTISTSKEAKESKMQTLLSGMDKAEGLWKMYHKDQRLLVELPASHLEKNFIVLTSIARGISKGAVIGGMSWGTGDSIIWSFRKVGDKIHVLRRNVRFRAKPGTPEADAVKVAYSDSVLYSLPVLETTSEGFLVDMTRIFMSDDQQIGRQIGMGFMYASDRSTLSKVKAFPGNVEIQVAAVYSGTQALETVSDPRGVQVHVHYSISKLPENGYEPRKADDRIGYFITALKDFSEKENDQNFVRYINRWNLKKKDPSAKLSPPEEPIVFHIEKTVPVHLRPYIQAGIEEWNKAFEKLGFSNAIVVLQQRDDDTWDPEDIRYNTFRWITADSGFAMGPSRVNPLTGQILDADIIFDASFLEYWKQDYETFTTQDVTTLMGGMSGLEAAVSMDGFHDDGHTPGAVCMLSTGMQQQMGLAATALSGAGVARKGELPEEFIHQALKHAVMHEVGHTLGLRHNFKASSWKSLKEVEETAACGDIQPMTASVMDYCPANIALQSTKQGFYFSQTVGPYDHWAIEYGYKPLSGKEEAELERTAARGIKEGLEYATDEDTRNIDPDPASNPFDLGDDPLEYARRQISLVNSLLPKIVERTVDDGEGYQRARQAFGMLLSEYLRAAYYVARVPGGVSVRRDHKGDSDVRPPFQVVEAARQREAMRFLFETVFASPEYEASLLNHLTATRWNHWGSRPATRIDYPIHSVVATLQGGLLHQLLNPLTLSRLQDSELKVPKNEETYTLAEHLRTIVDGIFSEFKETGPGHYENRTPFISSFRRNLQRMAFKQLANMVVVGTAYPEDARTLSRLYLSDLGGQIDAILQREDLRLDEYSRAHLLDSQNLVRQVMSAGLQKSMVN